MTPDGYTTGAKDTGYRDAAAIARDIRADLEAADLPREIAGHPVTISVITRTFSLGQSVDVTIRGLPDAVAQADRFHQDAESAEPGGTAEAAVAWSPPAWLTPAVAELKEAVRAIADAYNRTAVDRRHATYHLDVIVERDDERAWNAAQRTRRATRRAQQAAAAR